MFPATENNTSNNRGERRALAPDPEANGTESKETQKQKSKSILNPNDEIDDYLPQQSPDFGYQDERWMNILVTKRLRELEEAAAEAEEEDAIDSLESSAWINEGS